MKIKKLGNNRVSLCLSDLLNILLSIVLILNCQSVYQNTVKFNCHIYELTFGVIIIVGIYQLHLWGIKYRCFMNILFGTVLYCMYILFYTYCSIENDVIVSFWGRYSIAPIVFLIFCVNSPNEEKLKFIKTFINTVVIITIISLFFWFFGSILGLMKPTSIIDVAWGWTSKANSYFGIYFETQYVDWIGFALRRNTAIFVEGPMFCLVLIIVMLLELKYSCEIKMFTWKRVIMILGLLSSFSTSGLIFLMAILVIYVLKQSKNPWLLIMPLSIIGMVVVFWLIKVKSGTGSFALRMDDYIAGLKAWKDAPLMGNGFQNTEAIRKYYIYDYSEHGYSNSFFAILAEGGIYLCLLYILPIIIAVVRAVNRKQLKDFVLPIGYLFCLVTIVFQTFFINFFIWAILSLNISSKNIEKEVTE